MQSLLLVMLGGAVGAGTRHLTGRAMLSLLGGGFPYGTLTVNVVGGLLMGLLAGSLVRIGGASEEWRLLLGVGMLGGFTTFSAFALEVVTMLERGLVVTAVGYVLLSVTGAVLALYGGIVAARVLA